MKLKKMFVPVLVGMAALILLIAYGSSEKDASISVSSIQSYITGDMAVVKTEAAARAVDWYVAAVDNYSGKEKLEADRKQAILDGTLTEECKSGRYDKDRYYVSLRTVISESIYTDELDKMSIEQYIALQINNMKSMADDEDTEKNILASMNETIKKIGVTNATVEEFTLGKIYEVDARKVRTVRKTGWIIVYIPEYIAIFTINA